MAVCTTDDPADSSSITARIRDDGTFDHPRLSHLPSGQGAHGRSARGFQRLDWTASRPPPDIDCNSFPAFLDALRQRHDAFHALGGRLSDHGLNVLPDADCSDAEAARIFDTARAGREPFRADDAENFAPA